MGVTIIATLYSYEPVIAGVTKFGADRLVLLVDKVPLKEQEEALKKIKEATKEINFLTTLDYKSMDNIAG